MRPSRLTPKRGSRQGAAGGQTLADPGLMRQGAVLGRLGVDVAPGSLLLSEVDQLFEGVLSRSHGIAVKVPGLLDQLIEGPVVYGHGDGSLSGLAGLVWVGRAWS